MRFSKGMVVSFHFTLYVKSTIMLSPSVMSLILLGSVDTFTCEVRDHALGGGIGTTFFKRQQHAVDAVGRALHPGKAVPQPLQP